MLSGPLVTTFPNTFIVLAVATEYEEEGNKRHPCLSLCLSVNRISQKVGDGFGQNLAGRLGVCQGRICSILVKI